MIVRKPVFLLLPTIGGICAMILGGCGSKRPSAVADHPCGDLARASRTVTIKRQSPRAYGKIRVPAAVSVDLVRPECSGVPPIIVVSALTDTVASSGVITLRVPDIAAEPGRTEVLWAGSTSGFIAEACEYIPPALPIGRYHFAAILEFTPDRQNAEKLVLSQSLYLDVRPDRILSSNISFRQLERVELYRELEQRVLKSLNPGLAAADSDALARYRELMEATNPGLIRSMISELKAADPDVARRIAALNTTTAPTASSGREQ